MKPNFQKLWANFPDHGQYPYMVDLYTHLGGSAQKAINTPGFGPKGNTCASRLSHAFNKAGAPIGPGHLSGIETLSTADHKRIIFRVREFRKYLLRTLGKPTADVTFPFDDAFKGKKGIVAFSVNWGNASGHIALWNGVRYREPDHDSYGSYVNADNPKVKTSRGDFWELA